MFIVFWLSSNFPQLLNFTKKIVVLHHILQPTGYMGHVEHGGGAGAVYDQLGLLDTLGRNLKRGFSDIILEWVE